MDPRADERPRQALHAVVNPATVRASPLGRLAKPVFLVLVAIGLVAGIVGGLLRAGVGLPTSIAGDWLGPAIAFHAALMVCGFLGTVIGIERAVAVDLRFAFLAPLASGSAAVCLLNGLAVAAGGLLVLAALVFTIVNIVIVRRQPAAHTAVLLLSAVAWLAGNAAFATGHGGPATLAWWFAFLVLTIAAERLEMTRLMPRRAGALSAFHAIVGAMLIGAAGSGASPAAGGVLFGAALGSLAAWLIAFDIAKRTVFARGLSRYMAVCLLGGYAWLMVAGVAWAAMSLGHPTRDVALHALGLGFVVSMVMGHAPVILPAITRIRMQFGWPFYIPLATLHLSLAVRFGLGAVDPAMRADGAALNALALALFAATVLGGVVAWRVTRGKRARRLSRPG